MSKPPLPRNEKERINCLNNLNILYTPAEDRFDRITRLVKHTFNIPIVLITLVHTDVQWFKSVQGLHVSETNKDVSFCAYTILNDQIFIVEDTLNDERFKNNGLVTGEPYIRFYAGCPIEIDGQRIGTLCIIDHTPREFQDSEYEVLKDYTRLVENEILSVQYSQKEATLRYELEASKRQALLDSLTGCWNKGGIYSLLDHEMSKIKRNNSLLGLAMADIDNFKQLNDQYGHLKGDEIIKQVAQRIRASVRPYDAVGRYGGEEFLVILPDCTTESVNSIGNRILANIKRNMKLEDDLKLNVTISIGASSFGADDNFTRENLVEKVDALLYQAKGNGRDQLICH